MPSISDKQIAAINRLGARVPFPHPVPPHRDAEGWPSCPVCHLPLPVDADGITEVRHWKVCPDCEQKFDWSCWGPATEEELDRRRANEQRKLDKWVKGLLKLPPATPSHDAIPQSARRRFRTSLSRRQRKKLRARR